MTRWVFTVLLSNNNLFMSESFLSLAMFTLLYSLLDPYKLCWKKKIFFTKDLLLFSMFNFSWVVLDWRPTRQRLYLILYVGKLNHQQLDHNSIKHSWTPEFDLYLFSSSSCDWRSSFSLFDVSSKLWSSPMLFSFSRIACIHASQTCFNVL